MSLAGAGAGAAQGLDAYFAQLLQQQQGARGDRALDETVRKNKADEDYKLKALEDNNKTRLSVAGQAAADRESAQKDKEGTNLGKRLDELGDNSIVSPQTRSRALNLQAVPPERFKDYVPPSMGKSDPTQPTGQEEVGATPGGFPIVGSNASKLALRKVGDSEQNSQVMQELAGTRNDIAQSRADAAANRVSPDHFSIVPHYDENGKQIGVLRFNTKTGNLDTPAVPGGGGMHAPPAGNSRQTDAKKLGLGLIDDLNSQIETADQKGYIGPGAGRLYRDFMAGTVGSTGNPEADRLLGAIKASTVTFSPIMALSVGEGQRGATGAMGKRWDELVKGSASKDLMKGALDKMRQFISGDIGGAGGGVPQVGGMFQGGKVLSVTPAQ